MWQSMAALCSEPRLHVIIQGEKAREFVNGLFLIQEVRSSKVLHGFVGCKGAPGEAYPYVYPVPQW